MSFDYDIFISYAQPSEKESSGSTDWTLQFCDYLSLILKRLYDKNPVILLHDDLRARRNLLEESSHSIFSRTAVFVIVLSPEYVKSKVYLGELEAINYAISESNHEEGFHRVFKVNTLPVPLQDQPEFLQSEPSYDFFDINRYNKKPSTHYINTKEGPDQRFWSKLVDLAYDISNVLDNLAPREEDAAVKINRPGVFLAETTFDQWENRDMLKRELQHLGYKILPGTPLPEEAEKANQVINSSLDQSVLAIHLLGGWYGDFVKNSKYSLVDFQIKAVKEYISSHSKKAPDQVIWISSDLRPSDQRQALYLKRIKRDESQYKTEIVETSFEVFKTVLNGKLRDILHPPVPTAAEKNKIYVIYEKNPRDPITGYLELIRSKGFDILEPSTGNIHFYSISEHIENLLRADAVLIYKGDSTTEWLNSKIRDLVKTPGYGKNVPFRGVEIISPQKAADKSLIFLKNVPVNWDENISHDVINHFLDQLVKK